MRLLADLTPIAGGRSPRLWRQIIRGEPRLNLVADRLGQPFLQVVDLLLGCTGRVAITGTGKSADVGQKMAGTLNSTGTRSYTLDATRALHGDLGMVHIPTMWFDSLPQRREREILRILSPLRSLASALVGLTSNGQSTLARQADLAIVLGPLEEVCPLGLAPSTSTTAMIAVGDALAFVLSRLREFTHEDFARFHPAGSLGRKLLRVESVMRKEQDLRVASCRQSVRDVFAANRRRAPHGRSCSSTIRASWSPVHGQRPALFEQRACRSRQANEKS